MAKVKGLIWDEWNKEHIVRHKISIAEIEEVIRGKYKTVQSYRRRIQVSGITKDGRKITIILSPEDRELKPYENGIYYPITAFEEEVEK